MEKTNTHQNERFMSAMLRKIAVSEPVQEQFDLGLKVSEVHTSIDLFAGVKTNTCGSCSCCHTNGCRA